MEYLPKHKKASKEKLESLGTELFDKVTGLPYRGQFVQDFLGRAFKGSKLSASAEQLEVRYSDLRSDSQKYGKGARSTGPNVANGQLAAKLFISEPVQPSPQDYEKGTFPRYFCKDARTGKIIEVGIDNYKALKSQSKLNRRTLKIEWYVTGNPEDEIINGYLHPGTKAKNLDVIAQAEKVLPGIGEQILKDPSQFVVK